MARRKLAKVDLCRINTDAFRHMTLPQLKRASDRIGHLYEIPAKEKWISMARTPATARRRARGLLARFLFNLQGIREPHLHRPDDPKDIEIYRRKYNEEPTSNAKILASYRKEADYMERVIWDAQMLAGCKIKPDELVARDAVKQEQPRIAARIRRKAFISGR